MAQPKSTTSGQRPALRLVSTKRMNREDWLKIRKQGIGASDAAAAVGISPYQSPLELWMIKTGRDGLLPAPDPDDIQSPLYWGTLLEPKVAEAYAKITGNKVRRVNAVLQHPDDDKPWMLANLDYAVVGNDDVQILECKTTGQYGAKLWADGVPEYIQCQVQHQLAVTGKQAADVAVLICGQELQIHRIKRDEALIAHLCELEREFWQQVETDTPPDPEVSASWILGDTLGEAREDLNASLVALEEETGRHVEMVGQMTPEGYQASLAERTQAGVPRMLPTLRPLP
jgi:putative phage-type endonuclease